MNAACWITGRASKTHTMKPCGSETREAKAITVQWSNPEFSHSFASLLRCTFEDGWPLQGAEMIHTEVYECADLGRNISGLVVDNIKIVIKGTGGGRIVLQNMYQFS